MQATLSPSVLWDLAAVSLFLNDTFNVLFLESGAGAQKY